MIVQRSDRDLFLDLIVGALRTVESRRSGRPQRYGATGAGMDRDIVGAIGEAAYARILDRNWPGPPGPDDGNDVGGVGIRSTMYPRKLAWLPLHPQDADDRPFALAIVDLATGTVDAVGWILGADGKRAEWWQAPVPGRPCFTVPLDALNQDMDALRAWVDR